MIPHIPRVISLLLAVAVVGTFAGVDGRPAQGDPVRGNIITLAGGGVGDGGPAVGAKLAYLNGVTVGTGGELLLADACRVRRVLDGIITTAYGQGICGYAGDGGPAASALISPRRVVADGDDLYIITADCRIRRISEGVITLIAGNGICAYGGDGGAASAASLRNPEDLAVSDDGTVYVADTGNCRVRKISDGSISTVLGTSNCEYEGDGGPADLASIRIPDAVVIDGDGNLFVTDSRCRIRRIDAASTVVTTVVGGASSCYSSGQTPPSDRGGGPTRMRMDGAGDLYITSPWICRILRIDSDTFELTPVAGDGSSCSGYGGDAAPALTTSLGQPSDLAVSESGDLYIADNEHCRVRRVSAGVLSTIAGTIYARCPPAFAGEGLPPADAALAQPYDVGVNSAGTVVIGDTTNGLVRAIRDGVITTIAGCRPGFRCVYGSPVATERDVSLVTGVAVDDFEVVYLTLFDRCRVYRVDESEIAVLTGVAQSPFIEEQGWCGFDGDGGPAALARIGQVADVEVDSEGSVYIADFGNCRVRMVSEGIISTIAGTGTCVHSGDGGPAVAAGVHYPWGLAVDRDGVVYIAERGGCRVRKIELGVISTVAGSGVCGESGDGGSAIDAAISSWDVAVGSDGSLYIVGFGSSLRRVSGGMISTVAGGAENLGFGGDGGPAVDAKLFNTYGIAIDGWSNLYLADTFNDRIRLIYGEASVDSDGDGCDDVREGGANPATGGARDPGTAWDFFDVPTPALQEGNANAPRSQAISLSDVGAVIFYIGTAPGKGPNANGVDYDTDLNANGREDGEEYDRTPSSVPGDPWRSGPPSGAVSMQDALVALAQVGHSCAAS